MAPALTPVASTNIAMVGYRNSTRKLYVRFTSGDLYEYAEVPRSVYQAFLTAPSKGQFHREHIRDAYTYRKVSDAALMDLSDYELFSGVFSLIGAESTGLWF
jgi:hypothetical protein